MVGGAVRKFPMNIERPCICGCSFEDHAELRFKDRPSVYYCRKHVMKPGFWCVTYTPIDNLRWLEYLNEQKNSKIL